MGETVGRRRPMSAVTVLIVAIAASAAGCGDGDGDARTSATTVTVPAGEGSSPAGDAGDTDLGGDDCDGAQLTPDEDNRAAVERAALCLVNAERTKRDREALQDVGALTRAARDKARHMVEKNYFAHVGPDDRDVNDWVGETDYLDGAGSFRLGENLGWASEGAATPARIVAGWMESPSHRANILREEFRDSGIGVALGAPREGGGGATYVQVFGRR